MIALKGVRLRSVDIDKEGKVSGKYELLSTADKVLASQDFNKYIADIKIEMSTETKKLLLDFKKSLQRDVEATLGLAEAVA